MLLFFISCSSLSTPSSPPWLNTLYDKQYNEDTYLNAIGSGSSREKAVDAALSSLSQVFNSQVRSITTVLSTSTAADDGVSDVKFTESSELIDQSSVTSTTERIVGAEVVNTYIDSNQRVYVRVALHRKRSAELYQKEVFNLDTSIMNVRREMLSIKDPLRAYFTLSKAVGYAKRQQLLYDQIEVLLKKSENSKLFVVQNELNAIASSVKIAIKVEALEGKEVLLASFSQNLIDLGFSIVEQEEESSAQLVVSYESSPLNMANSPYMYQRYTISATLLSGSTTLYSYQKSEREAALSEEEAQKKALIQASTVAVDEFFTLLEQTLGDIK